MGPCRCWRRCATLPLAAPRLRRRWLCRRQLQTALAALGTWTLEIVRRSDGAKGFELVTRRWVVERTLAWLNRNRRLAKDFESNHRKRSRWLLMAHLSLLTRRLADRPRMRLAF